MKRKGQNFGLAFSSKSGLVMFAVILLAVFTSNALAQVIRDPYLGDEGFKSVYAEEEGYWYSRYNLGNLVMRSGMGARFMPDMSMIPMMIDGVNNYRASVGADASMNLPADFMPPAAWLINAVFQSGDPHYTQMIDPMDFNTQFSYHRWLRLS